LVGKAKPQAFAKVQVNVSDAASWGSNRNVWASNMCLTVATHIILPVHGLALPPLTESPGHEGAIYI